MRMRVVRWLFLCVTCVSVIAASKQDQHKSSTPCRDSIPTSGTYSNGQYGFSFQVPKGLQGLWNSARCGADCSCMSDHGRVVPLTREARPDRHIEVFAAYANNLDKPITNDTEGTDAEAAWRLDTYRGQSANQAVTLLQRGRAILDGVNARRLLVSYRDKNSGDDTEIDEIVVVKGGILYLVDLTTTPADYATDRKTFKAVVASFRWR